MTDDRTIERKTVTDDGVERRETIETSDAPSTRRSKPRSNDSGRFGKGCLRPRHYGGRGATCSLLMAHIGIWD
jgi:hypothetical protein